MIPRINPKQSLQYSSPFLVIYAIGLLIVSFINALPVTSNGFTWGFRVGIECKFTSSHIEDCLSEALGAKVSERVMELEVATEYSRHNFLFWLVELFYNTDSFLSLAVAFFCVVEDFVVDEAVPH